MSNKELKEGTLEICNLPDFSEILGCTTGDSDHTHLGQLFTRITACGKPTDSFMQGARDVVIDCPDCVAELTYRSKHSEAAQRDFGVVTHRKK